MPKYQDRKAGSIRGLNWHGKTQPCLKYKINPDDFNKITQDNLQQLAISEVKQFKITSQEEELAREDLSPTARAKILCTLSNPQSGHAKPVTDG